MAQVAVVASDGKPAARDWLADWLFMNATPGAVATPLGYKPPTLGDLGGDC